MTLKNIAVFFGGRSAEHEISVITALQLIEALDVTKFNPIPVYIDHKGRWFSGEALLKREFYKSLPESTSEVAEVVLLPIPRTGGLTILKDSKGVFANKKIIPVDLCITAFHGQFGEDGCMQGLFELADLPYTGCAVPASAVSMNKFICKSAVSAHGIPVLPGALVQKPEAILDMEMACKSVLETSGLTKFPLFVKPCNLGSSIGIGVAKDRAGLSAALANVFKYDVAALVEPCITNRMEINISVLDGSPPKASVVEIPVASLEALTYEDKYMRSGGKKTGRSSGMASLTRKIDPSDLDPKYKEAVTNYALKSFKLLECGGVVRFDFMVNLDTGDLFFNELNTIPGSFAFYLWAKTKPQVLYTEILNQIIEQAEIIYQRRASLQRDTGFRALMQ